MFIRGDLQIDKKKSKFEIFWECPLYEIWEYAFKGVLHPWPVFWLFMHFSQKLQHIGNK